MSKTLNPRVSHRRPFIFKNQAEWNKSSFLLLFVTKLTLLAFVDMTVYNVQQHSYNFELGSCITSSAHWSSNLASTDILHKEQVCLQLGVRPNFRNKWSRGQHWWDWGRFNSICCESLTWQLAGEPFPTTLQAVWESGKLQKERAKRESVSELVQGKKTISPEDPFESIEAILT